MVRAQSGGQSAYVGIYYWNNGSPDLMLFRRNGSNWAQLGATYNSGALAAGTQLQLMVVGSTISFLQNGVQRISATDTGLSGGAPGHHVLWHRAGRQLVRRDRHRHRRRRWDHFHGWRDGVGAVGDGGAAG